MAANRSIDKTPEQIQRSVLQQLANGRSGTEIVQLLSLSGSKLDLALDKLCRDQLIYLRRDNRRDPGKYLPTTRGRLSLSG